MDGDTCASTTVRGIKDELHIALKVEAIRTGQTVNDLYLQVILAGAERLRYYPEQKPCTTEEW